MADRPPWAAPEAAPRGPIISDRGWFVKHGLRGAAVTQDWTGARDAMVAWYRGHARDLPWRRASHDPYAVWVSEAMLQQTQVATALPYYVRWMLRFPTVRDLADAELDDVLAAWAGLGYYARARSLHAAARVVVERHAGVVPSDLDALRALPGVGPYTAAAIRTMAYDLPALVIDTNVLRVMARLLAIDGDARAAANYVRIEATLGAIAYGASPREIAQAAMEVGALVCSAAAPVCSHCPVAAWCQARAAGDPAAYPARRASRAAVREVHACAAVISGDRVLLVRRPEAGLWGGLWEMPRRVCDPGEAPARAARRAALEVAGITVRATRAVAVVRHQVTHHAIDLHAVRCQPGAPDAHPQERDGIRWVALGDLGGVALPAPQRAAIAAILEQVRAAPAAK